MRKAESEEVLGTVWSSDLVLKARGLVLKAPLLQKGLRVFQIMPTFSRAERKKMMMMVIQGKNVSNHCSQQNFASYAILGGSARAKGPLVTVPRKRY